MIHSFYSTTIKLSRKDPISSYSTKKEIQNLAQHLMSQLFDCNDTKEDGSNSSSSTVNEMSFDMCIEKATESNHLKEKSQGKSSLAEDMRFYEKSEKLTLNLQLLYDALAQISPTSVPSEQEFSKSANFMTNKRTKLSDKSFDDMLLERLLQKRRKARQCWNTSFCKLRFLLL